MMEKMFHQQAVQIEAILVKNVNVMHLIHRHGYVGHNFIVLHLHVLLLQLFEVDQLKHMLMSLLLVVHPEGYFLHWQDPMQHLKELITRVATVVPRAITILQ